jgi:hypothetical protein
MTPGLANDLESIRDFADELRASSGASMTLDEAPALWDSTNSPEEEREETIRSIQRGLEDRGAGRTVDALEFEERMRQS